MRNWRVIGLAVAVAALISVPLVAHHTGSFLYSDKLVTVKGTVSQWLWSNPHCVLTVDVKGADGQVVQWRAETQAPNTIYLEGYRARSFKTGDEVTMTVRAAANGGPFGQLVQAMLPDGTKLGTLPEEGARGRGAAARP
jgi:hypothetical protein